jgi:hypothetical protein
VINYRYQNWLCYTGILYGVHIDTFLVNICTKMGDYRYLCNPATLVTLSIGKVGDVIPKGQAYVMEISQSDRASRRKREIR